MVKFRWTKNLKTYKRLVKKHVSECTVDFVPGTDAELNHITGTIV